MLITLRFDSKLRRLAALALLAGAPVACGGGGGDEGGGGDSTGSGASVGDGAGTGGEGTGAGGTEGGSGGGSQVNNPGDYIFPNNRGPRVTFSTYEAEDMETNGSPLGPTREKSQVASEASGRRAVRLDAEGEYVQFTNAHPSNSVVVRYSIPDNGLDYWTKLTVWVDGVERTKLDVTSRYSWSYGSDENNVFNQEGQKNSGLGTPHHFFDETRALVGDIPVGATVQIRKSAGDNAAYYDIDLVEMEQVPEPLPQPTGYKSITECGATPNDDSDDTAAIQSCLDTPNALLYIPPGVFRVNTAILEVNRSTIRGAGMWHSTIMGPKAHFVCWNGDCKYYDFSLFGDTVARYDNADDAAFDGSNNNGVVLERIWIEHRRVGYWMNGGGNGISIKDCRMRNLHADGVNFYGGVTNSVVENSHFRGTGDDALAAWSHAGGDRAVNQGNTFRHNYVQSPWKANCFALYGGNDSAIEDNVCADVVTYPGILLARSFDSYAFGGMNTITRNTLLRAGGRYYDNPQGAIKIQAQQGPVDHVRVNDLDIVDATHFGIHITGGDYVGDTVFENVRITNPIDGGFFLSGSSKGAMDAIAVVYTGSANPFIKDAASSFVVNQIGDANSGW